MDEDIAIINKETRNEKIKNFFVKNKRKIIILISIIILAIFGYFIYEDFNKKNKNKLANKYNTIKVNFVSENKSMFKNELINIVYENDKTYSPLALYFIIDNDIISDKNKINELFDTVINETGLEKEINTFFRLDSESIISQLKNRFSDLPEILDEKTIFIKLRELRNDW